VQLLDAPEPQLSAAAVGLHLEAESLEQASKSATAPGNFIVRDPLDVVQVDHTQADILVVDTLSRRPIGRPWLSLAIDVATRCGGLLCKHGSPGAATVALLLTRVALPKDAWLDKLGVQVEWPMRGVLRYCISIMPPSLRVGHSVADAQNMA
jgi:putative transposase